MAFLEKYKLSYVYVFIIFIVIFLSVGYSAFNININIDEILSYVRIKEDIRVIGVNVENASDNVISNYEEYNKNLISSSFNLPNSDSFITYKIKITNFESQVMGISSISGLPDNLEYLIDEYTLGDRICDNNNKCNLGITKDIYITIRYKSGEYDVNDLDYEINLLLDFNRIYTINYVNLDNDLEYIMDGKELSLSLNEIDDYNNIKLYYEGGVNLTLGEDYNFVNGNLIVYNVTGNLIIEKIAVSSNSGIPLDDGMIPVKIANNGAVTTVEANDSSWYDYDNKEWANVVLVKKDATDSVEGSKSREYYKNHPGTAVLESDILAYYVWIPRYKYKIWSTSMDSSPQTIEIEFESKDDEISNGTTVDSWKTHPAFIWDENPIAGIWVGKFETGHSTLSDSTTSNNLDCNNENCANADGIIIKPNVVSLRNNNIANFFYASRSMSRTDNPFGFDSLVTDTHMLKNSEWGAVAYLSHSQYGINNEVRINNNSNYITGCGALEDDGSETTECQIAYGEANSYPQSTTGNISGIFDMSGGAIEYVMGNLGNTISLSGIGTLPASKYYDLYSSSQFNESFITNMELCTIETCGGHALFEVADWYNDSQYFPSSSIPWFVRGGLYDDTEDSGLWMVDFDSGYADNSYLLRTSIIVIR